MRYILVHFKFWYRASWWWHDVETCSSDIGLYLYISKVHLMASWMNSLTLLTYWLLLLSVN